MRLISRKKNKVVDPELIKECRDGNLQNFRKLMEVSVPFAFSMAFRMLGDEELAKDTVQETMITVWKKLGKIKSPDSYKTWLGRIVVNKCYDHLRKRKSQVEERIDEKAWEMITNHLSEDSSSQLENNEMAMIIKLLTEKLSPKQRMVFVLSDLEEMSADDIADVTGLSKRNIKANLHYARKNIGEMIKKYI